jgi:hypothetical protein
VIGRKAAQERFSEENFRNLATALFYITGNGFLNSSVASIRKTLRNSRHTTSLDELAEPNNYSNWDETSSTHLFASQSTAERIRRRALRLVENVDDWHSRTFAEACLLNPSPASTLTVFHSNERLAHQSQR